MFKSNTFANKLSINKGLLLLISPGIFNPKRFFVFYFYFSLIISTCHLILNLFKKLIYHTWEETKKFFISAGILIIFNIIKAKNIAWHLLFIFLMSATLISLISAIGARQKKIRQKIKAKKSKVKNSSPFTTSEGYPKGL